MAGVEQFKIFADVEHLETSIRAERGYTSSVVLLEGHDAEANEMMFKQRSHTDESLLDLSFWPEGLVVNNVQLTTKDDLKDMLNEFRGKVSTISVDFHDVLDFYSDITSQFIHWLLVTRQLLLYI